MGNTTETYQTPVGRIVQGSLWDKITMDSFTKKPLVFKDGSPRSSMYVGLAIAKNHAGYQGLMDFLTSQAMAVWPRGEWGQQGFAWKIYDGDLQVYAERDGFQGHTILRLTSNFDVNIYNRDGGILSVSDGLGKPGDYIDAIISVAGNGDPRKPGVFLNIHAARFIGHGQPIIQKADYSSAFSEPTAVPAGASISPVPPVQGIPAPPPVPPVPSDPVLTAKAGGLTYQQMLSAGWTDETLKLHGYLA